MAAKKTKREKAWRWLFSLSGVGVEPNPKEKWVDFCTILFPWLDLSIASIHIPPTCMRECFFIEPLVDSNVGSSGPGAYHLHIPLPTKFTQTISREY